MISAGSEAAGAAAVAMSLVRLAVQIRQNTQVMWATAKHGLPGTTQGLIHQRAAHADSRVKLTSGQAPSPPEQDAWMSLLVRAILRGLESQCHESNAGLLDAQERHALRRAMRDICRLPGVARYRGISGLTCPVASPRSSMADQPGPTGRNRVRRLTRRCRARYDLPPSMTGAA